MKTCMALLMSVMLAFGGGSSSFAQESASSSHTTTETLDVAKMYRISHELTMDVNSGQAVLDGRTLSLDKPIMKNGRVFVSLRTLRAIEAVNVLKFDASAQQVQVIMNSELKPPFEQLIFRVGSDKVYMEDGSALPGVTIAKPFIAKGVTYIPIQALTYVGISPATSKQKVTMKWSNKVLELLQPKWKTDKDSITFTMLYQKDMNTPSVATALSGGSWVGGNDHAKVLKKDISLDGRQYNRIEFTLPLHPGPNALKITAVSGGEKSISVMRKVSSEGATPVRLSDEGKKYIAFDQSASGYVRTPQGGSIDISGRMVAGNEKLGALSFTVQQYDDEQAVKTNPYKDIKEGKMPIQEQAFKGSVKLQHKGYYLITLYSADNVPAFDRGAWAEIVVEVY
ncbi:stalk domain-containing protein [Paenibacillus alvei]|uniref:stalk domain-containing protein n=1 Tax=Paenibacillus alvei TaxID=44250 RepID=UPI00227E7018|nr:stalk domain-containing protein [Paenibacillus alvei]